MNGMFQEIIKKFDLVVELHLKRYQVSWVNGEKILVTSKCKVEFTFG